MKNITVLIKPSSSLCNLRCKYCFYEDISNLREVKSYGNMTIETMTKLIDHVYDDLEDGDGIKFSFQGGEPAIIGLEFYKQFVMYAASKAKKVKVEYSFQTNGTLIDEKWCQFLKENNFLVGLSIDSAEKFHDKNRVDCEGRGTFHKVIKTKELFDKFKIDYNVLCVLTEQIANKPYTTFDFILKNDIKYIQFIPCLDELSRIPGIYALKPQSFAKFYKKIFDLWKLEYQSGNYISIKLLDDVGNLINHGYVGACGLIGKCQVQYIIEADGSVYPCDFYALDRFKMGNIRESTLKQLFEQSQVPKEFIYMRKSPPVKCNGCNYFRICGGGCKRMERSIYVDEKADYCGYQDFLSISANYFKTLKE